MVTIVSNIFEVTDYLGLGNRDEHFGNPEMKIVTFRASSYPGSAG